MKNYNNFYVSCEIRGPGVENAGLGNQLFCIATTIAYSLKYNKIATFPEIMTNLGVNKYLNVFYKNLNTLPFGDIHNVYTEKSFSFDAIPGYSGNVFLKGYFQSEKYFVEYREEILKALDINRNIKQVREKYKDYSDYTSIHVRRGDYLKLSEFHTNLSMDYYKSAVANFSDKEKFLIFSDDIEWCKDNLNFLDNIEFSPCNKDYEDLILMSTCKNNIMANSSFSWWAAWINNNKEKLVIYPENWFGIKNRYMSTDTLCPLQWKKNKKG